MKHLLSLEKLPRAEIERILRGAALFKQQRKGDAPRPLAGQTWALLFTKSSTRTRVSFEVGIRELGGQVMFLSASDIQLGRGEPIKDTARVSGIPTINALTDDEHPCQVLTDLFTFEEKRGRIAGKVVTFIGDGACNMPVSWIFAAAKLGFELRIAAPRNYQPSPDILARADANVLVTDDLETAASGADLLYTDVWVSMGKESESTRRIRELTGYQINDALLKLAKPNALVMHCLPAHRGKEIDERTFEEHAQTIFDQAENRLHVQKAILDWVVS